MRYVNFPNISYGLFCLAVLAALLKLAVPSFAEPLNLASETGNTTEETTGESSVGKPSSEETDDHKVTKESTNFAETTGAPSLTEQSTAERTTTERPIKEPSSNRRSAMVPVGESARSAPAVVDEAVSMEKTAADRPGTPQRPPRVLLRGEQESAIRNTAGETVPVFEERRSRALDGFERFEPGASAVRVEPPVFYRPAAGRSRESEGSTPGPGTQCANLSDVPGNRRAIFPLPAGYANSYDDTWGAPRVQGGHEGTDLMSPSGTPEYAITDGTLVPVAGANRRGWNTLGGYTVMLRADYDVGPIRKGDLFYYAHMNRRESLPLGTRVRAGQQIGVAGDTGQGPEITRGLFPAHLHLGWYDTSGARTNLPSGAMNPFPLLEWLKSNGGVVSGGTDTRYCEAPQKPSPTPSTGDKNWQLPSTPGLTPDLKTGTGESQPSPVVSGRTPDADSQTEKTRPENARPTALRNPNISRSVTGEIQRPSPENTLGQSPKPGTRRTPQNGRQPPNQQNGERNRGKSPESRTADRPVNHPRTVENSNGLKTGASRSASARPGEQRATAKKPGPDREGTVPVDNSPVTDEVRDAVERRNREPETQKPDSTSPPEKRKLTGSDEKTGEHRAGERTRHRDPEGTTPDTESTNKEKVEDTLADDKDRNEQTDDETLHSDDQYQPSDKSGTPKTTAEDTGKTTGPDGR